MQNWDLTAGDPLSLILAADARLSDTDYTDDQIWELRLGGGEPPALAVQTTYGLRAHWMRLFPRFVRGEQAHVDPNGFHTPPRIKCSLPNYLMVTFAPYDGLEVMAEYWAAESQVISGRIRLTNHSILPLAFRLEWIALLNPINRQGGMAAEQHGPTHVLAGETSYLYPVVVLTGGPQPISSPYPALAHDMELYPGNSRQFSWAAAAMRSPEASLEATRLATGRPWEAELARVELLNCSQSVQVQTGSPDWDAAFALAQNTAVELLMKNPQFLPHPSFVLSRQPDHGFSLRGDGSDQNHLWNGQTALDAYYLASLLLPGAPEIAAGLVRNFLAVQEIDGKIDWKPGLGGQRSRRMAQPLLATLAARIAPYMDQPDWYREVFPPLLRFFNAWFLPELDRDGDGFPEWQHPLQTGLEDSPIYDHWSPRAQGMDITCIESPALAAMLYSECCALIEMAEALVKADQASAAYARLSQSLKEDGAPETVDPAAALEDLRARQTSLRAALDECWDDGAGTYRYRDYQTHLSPAGQTLLQFTGPGKASSRKRLDRPSRLMIELDAREERTYAVSMTLTGFNGDGEISETLEPRSFVWMGKRARATTSGVFLALKRVEVTGIGDEDQVRVATASYTQEDCSLLLPLWAGAMDDERARRLVEETLAERYLKPFGLTAAPPGADAQEELPGVHTALSSALLPWNLLIAEGMLRYGYRSQAADLLTRLMNAVVGALKENQSFRQYYHAETGLAAGERGHLHGLAPLGLFLATLGLRQLTPKALIIDGFSPYPSTIHVQYRKIRITCQPDKTEVEFPGGQKVTVDRPGLHRIILS